MNDLKIDNLESETLIRETNELTEQTLLDETTEIPKPVNTTESLDNNVEENNNISSLSEDAENNNKTNIDEVANCLALTVKKDYSLSIAKNVFIKTIRSTWKIVLSVFTLNFLKFFL